MKKYLFFVLFFWMCPAFVFANNSWQTYQSKFLQDSFKAGQGEFHSGEEIEGFLETVVVDNSDYSHERYFVLRTKDGRYIDLAASGVEESELRRFSREHPVIVRIQIEGSVRGEKSELIFLTGKVWDIRQSDEWIQEKASRQLLFSHSNFLQIPQSLRVGFVSINVNGRSDESHTSVTPNVQKSFAAHVNAMTYGKIIVETGPEDVFHINRSEMPQLSCSRGLWVLGHWAVMRAFPNKENYDKYDRLIVIYPFKKGEDCGWWGVTTVRENALEYGLDASFGYMLIRSGLPGNGIDTMVHEFGHSLGFNHSAMDMDGDGDIYGYEEYGDPECAMANEAYSYNPIHLENLGVLKIGQGIENAVDGEEYELASALTADPLDDGIVVHPYSLDGPNPRTWGGGLLSLKVGKYYISRSIEDEDFVFVRKSLDRMFYGSGGGFETTVEGRVRVGESFRFPNRSDGICVIGENPDNTRIYVSYHSPLEDDHECAPSKELLEVGANAFMPKGLEILGGQTVSTDSTPTIRVRGVKRGHMVRVYTDDACRDAVGFGVARGRNTKITAAPLPVGYHTFYARSGPSLAELSPCSNASVDYGVALPEDPSAAMLVEPAIASHTDDTPTVRIEGVESGDTVKVYRDSLCTVSASYPVIARDRNIEIDILPLPEGESYRFYVQYIRGDAHYSDCWDSGVRYSVLADPNREPLRTPTLEMPENILIRTPDYTWSNVLVSDNPTPTLRVYPTTYRNGELSIYTDSECKNKVGSTMTVPKRLYRKILGKRVVFDYSYVFVYVKLDPLGPGEHILYAQSRIGESFSECSTDYARYIVQQQVMEGTANERPEPPTSVTVVEPSEVVSSMNHSPVFQVDGVLSGDTVRLHRDPECLMPLEHENTQAVASDTNVLVSEEEMYVGTYTVYASTTRNGIRSDCSTAFASYEVLAPKPLPPKSIKVVGPKAGISNTPIVEIGDALRVYEYDEVKLYTDFNCTVQVGSTFADYNPPGEWYGSSRYFLVGIRTDELPLGEHTFYATVTRDGQQSNCSRAGDRYEVLSADNSESSLLPPKRLVMVKPKDSKGTVRRPMIKVVGVGKSDVVALFIDDRCTQKVGERTALKKGSVRIRSKRLSVGKYRFYANRTRKGVTTACSTAYVDYEVVLKDTDS